MCLSLSVAIEFCFFFICVLQTDLLRFLDIVGVASVPAQVPVAAAAPIVLGSDVNQKQIERVCFINIYFIFKKSDTDSHSIAFLRRDFFI